MAANCNEIDCSGGGSPLCMTPPNLCGMCVGPPENRRCSAPTGNIVPGPPPAPTPAPAPFVSRAQTQRFQTILHNQYGIITNPAGGGSGVFLNITGVETGAPVTDAGVAVDALLNLHPEILHIHLFAGSRIPGTARWRVRMSIKFQLHNKPNLHVGWPRGQNVWQGRGPPGGPFTVLNQPAVPHLALLYQSLTGTNNLPLMEDNFLHLQHGGRKTRRRTRKRKTRRRRRKRKTRRRHKTKHRRTRRRHRTKHRRTRRR